MNFVFKYLWVLTLLSIKHGNKTSNNFPFMVYDFNELSVNWQFVFPQPDQGNEFQRYFGVAVSQ